MLSKLQYISQGTTPATQYNNIHQALDAGCEWVQLRFKNQPEATVRALAHQIKPLCEQYKATLIINDFPEIAREVDADGVHLGLTDRPIADARKIVGPHKIVGGTANTLDDVLQRIRENCDYVGLGPFRFTATKQKLSPILGIEGYHKIMEALKQRNLSIPVYAIGGILPEDMEALMSANVHGVAVSGMITQATQKKEVVTQIKSILYGTFKNSRQIV